MDLCSALFSKLSLLWLDFFWCFIFVILLYFWKLKVVRIFPPHPCVLGCTWDLKQKKHLLKEYPAVNQRILGCQKHSKNYTTETVIHHCAVDILWGCPCWHHEDTECTVVSTTLSCTLLFMLLAPDSESWLGVSVCRGHILGAREGGGCGLLSMSDGIGSLPLALTPP